MCEIQIPGFCEIWVSVRRYHVFMSVSCCFKHQQCPIFLNARTKSLNSSFFSLGINKYSGKCTVTVSQSKNFQIVKIFWGSSILQTPPEGPVVARKLFFSLITLSTHQSCLAIGASTSRILCKKCPREMK